MFKNAIEKINKFYELDLNKNSHADEIFDVLNEIIRFDSAAIFYLTPERLTLEFGKNYEIYEDIKLDEKTSKNLYNLQEPPIFPGENNLCSRLIIKDTVFGLLVIFRDKKNFTPNFTLDEKLIFKTCSQIISNLIKDLELSKVLQMQVKALEEGIIETQQAYETIKKQNKKIKANEKLQNQFIANVSHDLRTPLNSIIGFSEILGNRIFGELTQKQAEYIDDIRIAGIRLLGMINEILDISKLESNTVKLNISSVDINILIEEVCNILKPLYQKKGVKVVKYVDENLSLSGDYIKLQQVIFNLLGNAIKFSPQNSEIHIKAGKKDNSVYISIKDEGIGIDKKYHKKIFNKFFQIADSLSKTETSTGLGLTIAKEFVKLHNGKIDIISEPANGTTFIITLPSNTPYGKDFCGAELLK